MDELPFYLGFAAMIIFGVRRFIDDSWANLLKNWTLLDTGLLLAMLVLWTVACVLET